MKVLHIVGGLPSEDKPFFQPFVKSQIDSLIHEGLNVEVFDIQGYKSFLNYFRSVPQIKKIVIQKKIDLIHAHYSYCGLSALLAGTRIPIVLSLMGSDLLGSPNLDGKMTLRGKIDRMFSRYIIRKIDHVIVKSQKMKDKIKVNVPISVIPNGVNLDFFQQIDNFKSKKELGFRETEFLILFLGNSKEPRKNYPLAKDSFNLLKKKINANNIRFVNPFGIGQNEIVKYMNAADVLLLTSFWEGSPNVIKEAMACNLPIISVDVGDVKERIENTFNCFIVDYSKEDISEKLELIYHNKKRSNGREKILDLSSNKIAQSIIQIYSKVLYDK